MNREIGRITKKVIRILELDYDEEQSIFIGDANIKHMQERHALDFERYGQKMEDIIKNPTYLARNQKKKSIEFIKEYKTQSNDYVLIAVRVSNNGVHFARTMYIMADEKVEKYLKHNYFHKF